MHHDLKMWGATSMSLLDIDKVGANRTRPTLNASDTLATGTHKAHATEGIAYRSEEASSAPRVTTKDDQITVSDGTDTRIIVGRLPDGTYGMVITKEGYDVNDVFS